MSKDKIEEIVIGAFKDVLCRDVSPSHHMNFDLSVDSIDIAEIIMLIEEGFEKVINFEIYLEASEFFDCKMVQDVIDKIDYEVKKEEDE